MSREFEILAGMLAKIAYEMSFQEGISEDLKEMCLEFWRRFDYLSGEEEE